MKNLQKHLRAAIVQAAPVLFDKKATLEKVVRQIQEATANGAELIVFPESLVPCYPYGLTFGFTVGSRKEEGRKDWKVYYDNAVLVPDDTVSLAAAAKKARAWVSIGVTERDPVNCSLYCTNLVFSPEGKLASVHRKIKPTGSERYIWADSHVPETYFPVVDTPWGRMGSLICWENYMPLARVALYQKGISLYLAPNTNDNPEWQDTIRHIAIEGHCYVFNVDQYFTRDMYPADLLEQEEIGRLNDIVCRGGSCIIDPYGHCVTEPVWDREAIVYADLDMDKVPMSRMEFDATGHYTRPDILELKVHDGEGC
ncbi:carbon-nitrogen hydrolase family protein [uncultured Acidaminococcus sp.]|jgi:nitrilase|uniref:carbon-nitrogen hydrolase family protein n=1 Tax=uncultured Acidaminococcus sp. TaxID=352152 RepID=UPI00265FE41B|nr:carbon-nitrogen hydrolase family protein [uncultured Acidaminococcus sp.]